jgi:hypothetical protein
VKILASRLGGNSREEAREIGYEFHSTISSLERENANFRVLIFQLFSLSEYYDKDCRKYYDAIQSVRENEMDLTTWLEYFTEGLKSQLVEVKIKGERTIKRDVLHEKIRDSNLNPRQKKALDFLIEHKQMDNSTYQEICDTTKRTATRDKGQLRDMHSDVTVYCDKAVTSTVTNCVPSKVHTEYLSR